MAPRDHVAYRTRVLDHADPAHTNILQLSGSHRQAPLHSLILHLDNLSMLCNIAVPLTHNSTKY